jgi:Short C-terminal domain
MRRLPAAIRLRGLLGWAYAEVHDEEGRQQIRALFGEKAETITGVGDPMAVAPPAASAADPLDRLKKLDELRATGVLTDDEFESKKAALLAEI